MIASAVRLRLARAVPRGLSETTARDVQQALESTSAEAAAPDIARILAHASENVPFYRRLGAIPLAELPVVTKAMMVADPRDFYVDGIRLEKLTPHFSSGSSGIPFTSYFDAGRLTRHRAELVSGYRFLGADPFGPIVHCRSWIRATARERVSFRLRGQYLYGGEQDEQSVRRVARWIGRRRGVTLMGMSSFLERLLRSFEEFDLTVPGGAVTVVLAVGEPASAYLKAAAPRHVGTALSIRYSNTENGVIGFAKDTTQPYQLDTSTFLIEILALDSDEPAPPGDVGRLVITDLYNRATPFIRYDTGDLGRFATDERGLPIPNALAELVGRRSDFPIGGTEQSPVRATLYQLLMKIDSLPTITQFQLRQNAIGRFTYVLNAEESPQLNAALRLHLEDEIGDILSCEFQYTQDIPLEVSGKRRFFVCEIPDPEGVLAAGGRTAR